MLTAAIIIFLVIFAIIVISRQQKPQGEYDERQVVLRGRAFQLSLYTVTLLATAFGILLYMEEKYLIYAPFLMMLSVFTGFAVFAIVTIWTDSFHRTLDKSRGYFLLCLLVVITNAVSLLSDRQWSSFQELAVSVRGLNLLMCLCFGAVLIAFAAKAIADKREAE